MALNDKYSYKDFTGKNLAILDPLVLNNTEIVGSCFAQQEPGTKVFPDGMVGVTFRRCNLDNVVVPTGNTVITDGSDRCCQRRVAMQNDGEYWIVDQQDRPIEPRNKGMFQKLNMSVDPKDIPGVQVARPATQTALQAQWQSGIDSLKSWNSEIAKQVGY